MPESGPGLALAAARTHQGLLADRAQVVRVVAVAAVVDDCAPVPQQRLPLASPTQHVASPREPHQAEGSKTTGGDERDTLVAGEAA